MFCEHSHINLCVDVCLNFLRYIPIRGAAGLYGDSMFDFEILQNSLKWPHLIFQLAVGRFQLRHIFAIICYHLCFL